jgi:lipopolysaccharide transport system ATP-binding protein
MGEMVAAHGISKKYRLGASATAYKVLREQLFDFVRRGFHRAPPDTSQEFWALQDVSFSIGEAEVVGLIGKNGAGKSTMLKILSRITEPTSGEVHLWGKVASLLEVGIGFHPELTGRENVYLNGAILGMPRAEIRRKFDEIVQFAEIDRFLDTPVKRYSSGMYVRLAFAVAAHLEPDILVVDEVLAVGDAAFQQKCLGKMRDVRAQGHSVIVVSHNMTTVTSLCQRAIWLRQGEVAGIGTASEIVRAYLNEGRQDDIIWKPRHPRVSAFEFHSISVPADAFAADAPIDVAFDIEIHEKFPAGRIEARLINDSGETLFTTTSADGTPHLNHDWALGRQTLTLHIPGNLLAPGRYFLTITEPYGTHDIVRENVLAVSVTEQNSVMARDQRQGKIAPLLSWTRSA